MMGNSVRDQDYELWVLLAQTRELMYKARQKELAQYNISPQQSAVLFIIKALGDEVTPAEIARYLLREHHSVSELLKRMEKDGLVSKIKDSAKKGRVKILLTQKGEQANKHSMKRKSIKEIISCLSDEERQQLQSSLKKLRDSALKLAVARELPFP